MTLASLGWGTWWLFAFLHRVGGATPSLVVPSVISSFFALLGLLLAVWSFRATRAWMLFVLVPLLANLSLFFVPWFAEELTRQASP